jgi:hypothetical protein
MDESEKLYLGGIWRPLVYALSIFFVFFFLIIQQYHYSKEIYFLLGFLGGVLIFEESFFTVYYANKYTEKSLSYFLHGFNHTIYPQFFYVGLILYSYIQKDYFIGFGLALLSFFIYLLYFYFLPKHIHYDHSDVPVSKASTARVDFLIYIFKFLSYFTFHLALFGLLQQGYISDWHFLIANLLVTFVYLSAHLSRKYEVSYTNLFFALLFSIITSIFIFRTKIPTANYSASISTLIFYLTSGIFYHKVDGTFNYKVLFEYASIALILSVFLFAV